MLSSTPRSLPHCRCEVVVFRETVCLQDSSACNTQHLACAGKARKKAVRSALSVLCLSMASSLADGAQAQRTLEHKLQVFASEREGGFAGVLQSSRDAEFAQVCVCVC